MTHDRDHDSDNPPPSDDDLREYVARLDRRTVRIDERLSEIVRTMGTLRNLFAGLVAIGIAALVMIGAYKERVDTLQREVDTIRQQQVSRGPRARIQHE